MLAELDGLVPPLPRDQCTLPSINFYRHGIAVASTRRAFFRCNLLRSQRHGEVIRTFCIITCPANELVTTIHDRMPVILPPETYERWLAIEPDPRDLLVPCQAELIMMWPISTRVNKPEHDDPTILDPLEPVEGGSPLCCEGRCEAQSRSSQCRAAPVRDGYAAGQAVADYHLEGNVTAIYLTEVPLPLRGRGKGNRAKKEDFQSRPGCQRRSLPQVNPASPRSF